MCFVQPMSTWNFIRHSPETDPSLNNDFLFQVRKSTEDALLFSLDNDNGYVSIEAVIYVCQFIAALYATRLVVKHLSFKVTAFIIVVLSVSRKHKRLTSNNTNAPTNFPLLLHCLHFFTFSLPVNCVINVNNICCNIY